MTKRRNVTKLLGRKTYEVSLMTLRPTRAKLVPLTLVLAAARFVLRSLP